MRIGRISTLVWYRRQENSQFTGGTHGLGGEMGLYMGLYVNVRVLRDDKPPFPFAVRRSFYVSSRSPLTCPGRRSPCCVSPQDASFSRSNLALTPCDLLSHQPIHLKRLPTYLPHRLPFSLLTSTSKHSHTKAPNSSLLFPLALPSSQSVTLTTRLARSQLPLSSACSMVCVRMRPSSSNSKMKRPQKASSLSARTPSHSVSLEMGLLALL